MAVHGLSYSCSSATTSFFWSLKLKPLSDRKESGAVVRRFLSEVLGIVIEALPVCVCVCVCAIH